MKRRILTLLLALALVLTMLPMTALAADEATTLPDAVDNTITLEKNVVLSGDSTLDLTGKTVVTNGYSITIASGTTTITGGTFNNTVEGVLRSGNNYDQPHSVFIVANGATLNLTGSKVNTAAFAPIYVLGVCNLESTDIHTTVANNNYDSRAMLVVQGANAKLNMKSGSITMEPSTVMSDGMYGIYAYEGGSVTLGDESTHTGPTVATHFAALGVNHETAPSEWKIYGGEYTSTAKATTEWWKYFCGALYLAGSCQMDIYGGSFSGGNYTVCMPWADADVKLNIHGGSFTETDGDGILYYRKNTAATTQTMPVVTIDDGTFFGSLFAGDFYNSLPIVKGGAYTALASAMSLAEDNTTIKLADDITVNSNIALDTYSANPITVDLNGHNIRFAKDQYFYINGGNLTLTGKGTVEETVPNYGPILMKGSLMSENYSVVNVGKDVTLRGWTGIFVDQNGGRNAGLVVNVDGKIEGVRDVAGSMGFPLIKDTSTTT